MGLTKYTQKRSFDQTPEPKAAKGKTGPTLRFVVQKHAASHLHYDFRLEMEGVLKSWAVPKGPSTDPAVKRLAMMVEDHPYDYRTFEGTIPEGNYGAGTVIVWDEGTYEPAGPAGSTKKEMEKQLLHQWRAGKIRFVLHGEKLQGEFALVKSHMGGENAWLLMKLKDAYASPVDITQNAVSVQSGLTLEEVKEAARMEWKGGRAVAVKAKKTPAKKAAPAGDKAEKKQPAGRRAAFPSDIKPMLATLKEGPFDSPDWIYEIKWDGYRAVSYLRGGRVEIRSRNNQPFTDKFSDITQALAALDIDAVLDGEIIVPGADGAADFRQLQNFARSGREAELIYYVFDLLWYEGRDMTALPLGERKTVLRDILPQGGKGVVRYSDHIRGDGTDFFRAAIDAGLEGVMAKRIDSRYVTDSRTQSWLKIKNNHRMEAVICGYTEPRNSRKYFGALILGKYNGGKLEYIGHTGSGFSARGLKEMYEKFRPLVTDTCPFKPVPKTNMPVTWLRPGPVCEVKFAEWTDEGVLRQPIFLGLREDKTAKDERNEKVVPSPATVKTKKQPAAAKQKTAAPKPAPGAAEKAETPLLDAAQKEAVLTVDKKKLTFTHLDKLYFPKEKVTKRDVLNYYDSVAEFILPYMKDRPQSLNRHPNGITGPNFFQKDVKGKVADWITTYFYRHDAGSDTEYLVCKDRATLLYMANLGCIEMNPWHSRVQAPESPDWCVIDLDPDTNSFDRVVETARVVKQVLDAADVPACCKTSGATGMHIYIPLGGKYGYDQSKMLAELVVTLVHRELPKFTSLERMPAKRKGRIYLDFLQNRSIQTIAAPYSLRPRPGATVSMPLHWDEVKKGLSVQDFNIWNALERIRREGDLFRPVLGKGIRLEKVLERMQGLVG